MTEIPHSYQEGTISTGRKIFALTETQLTDVVRSYLSKNGTFVLGDFSVRVTDPHIGGFRGDESGVTAYVYDAKPAT